MTPRDPSLAWRAPIAERLGLLKRDTIRIGYFYETPDLGSFRYRSYNMAQAINSHSKSMSASYFYLSDIPLIDDFSKWLDVLVLVRFRFSGPVSRLIDQFRSSHKTVLFDIDDLIFDPSHLPLLATSLDVPLDPGLVLDNWYALTARLGETLRACDAVIASTPTIAREVERLRKKQCHVLPNFLNEEQVEVSRDTPKKAPSDSSFTLGYFSGSKSHARDFAVASGGISALLSATPDSRLVVGGYLEIPEALKPFEDKISTLPFMDFVSLQSAIASVDINLAPLQRNLFTDSKSELKFFEAAAVGVPTIASPTEVYARVVSDGVTGYLAEPGDWEDCLMMTSNLPAAELRRVGQAAREVAFERYTGASLVESIEEVFLKRTP